MSIGYPIEQLYLTATVPVLAHVIVISISLLILITDFYPIIYQLKIIVKYIGHFICKKQYVLFLILNMLLLVPANELFCPFEGLTNL